MNMPTSSNKSFGQPASNVGDDLAGATDRAAGNAQRTVENAADALSSKIQDVRDQAAPLINRVSAQAQEAAKRGIDAVRDSSAQLRERAQKATDTTVAYVNINSTGSYPSNNPYADQYATAPSSTAPLLNGTTNFTFTFYIGESKNSALVAVSTTNPGFRG